MRTAQPALLTYGAVPEFSLIDRTSKSITLDDLKGNVWVADFIFTNCAGTCPLISEQMSKLQETLPREIRFVSFTVDPLRDTPEVLAQYAKRYKAERNRWFFLTGDKAALHDLCVKGFKLALDEASGTEVEPITHSTRFVLIDKQGRIRGYYGGTDANDLARLSVDVKKLL